MELSLVEELNEINKKLKSQPNNLQLLQSKAYCLNQSKQYSEAIPVYDQILELDPNSQGILRSKAYCLNQSKQYSEAIPVYDQILELDPNSQGILRSKAYCLSKDEQYSEAITMYDQILELDPNDLKTLQSKAYCLSKDEQYSEAIPVYDQILELDPNNQRILRSKAHCLSKDEQFHSSLQLIEKILDDPNFIDVSLAKIYAQTFVKIFPNDDATQFFNSKINLNKHNLSWYLVLIHFYKLQNKFDEIIQLCENNIILLNESIVLVEIAQSYELQNKFDESIKYCTMALEKNPDNLWALYSRGQNYLDLKQYDLALEDFKTGFEKSQRVHFQESYAYVLDLLGNYELAISVLSKYKNSNRRLNVLKVLGLIYRNNRKYDESLDCYNQILQENKNDANGLVGCALVYDSQNKFDLALKNIEKSLEINGYDEFSMKIKVEILIKMNEFEQAQENLILMQQNKSSTLNTKIESNSEFSSYIKSSVREELEKINPSLIKNNFDDRTLEIKNLYNLPINKIFDNAESDILEYKSTLRYDIRTKQTNKELEMEVLQTICAFLNTHGGILVVGYNDDENIIQGLEQDYQTLGRKKDWDGWQQKLENLIKNLIGTTYSGFITISRETLDDENNQKELAKIKIQKSSRSAYLKTNNSNEFFARRNGQSDKLDTKESIEWIKDHNLN